MGTQFAAAEQTGPRVLVLGGAGFVGRHVVRALLASGYEVTIGSRHPTRAARRLPEFATNCGALRVRMEHMLQPSDWSGLLMDVDVVINCVGILRQRGAETYQRVHHLAVAALAGCCADNGRRLIHVSALGLQNPVRSRFLLSKRAGETALLDSGADCWLVRPSLLAGEGGFGARWLRRVARWPLHLLPANANGRIAVLDVRELGRALAALVLRPAPADPALRIFELGGDANPTLLEYLAGQRARSHATRALALQLPAWLARLTAHVCDVLHSTPYSFGHYELLKYDNIPQPNRLHVLLPVGGRGIGCPEGGSVAQAASGGPIAAAWDRPPAAHPATAPSRA